VVRRRICRNAARTRCGCRKFRRDEALNSARRREHQRTSPSSGTALFKCRHSNAPTIYAVGRCRWSDETLVNQLLPCGSTTHGIAVTLPDDVLTFMRPEVSENIVKVVVNAHPACPHFSRIEDTPSSKAKIRKLFLRLKFTGFC
jgi:hypothetical protein